MTSNSTYQTFQSRNKSDIKSLDQIIEEDGIHYNIQSLLKYPQSRAKIKHIQNTENLKLSTIAVSSLTPRKTLNPNTTTEPSISALMQHIEKLERKLSKFEPDLKFIHRLNLDVSQDLSKE